MREQEYIAEVLFGEDYDELTLAQQAVVDDEVAFRKSLGWRVR